MLTLFRLALMRYPAVIRARSARHKMYNLQMDEIDEREKSGASLVIRPLSPLNIGHVEKDPAELERVYMLGRADAERRLNEIKAFLAGKESE